MLDPLLARLLWAILLSLGIGSALVVLVSAVGRRRREDEVAAYAGSLGRMLVDEPGGDPDDTAGKEASFELGARLRQRGDIAAAIRTHEKLMRSAGLDAVGKRAAATELARDFHLAGLVARAVATLEAVVAEDGKHQTAHRLLRELHEEMGEWELAAAAEEKLLELGSGNRALAAHLWAHAARAHLREGRPDRSGDLALRAVSTERSADAMLAMAEVDLSMGRTAQALSEVAEALTLRPEALPLVYPGLEAAFDARPEGLGLFLAAELGRRPGDTFLRLCLARHLRRRGQQDAAATELRRLLAEHPSLLEAHKELAAIALERGTPDDLRAQLSGLLAGLSARRHAFRCDACRLELDAFAFRCSMCGSWDTVRRIEQAA